jgi:nitrite reductase/ring-hydroxylating ferredoxin subunit
VASDTGLRLDDLEPGQARVVDVGNTKLLLIRLADDEVRATSAWCTHARTMLGAQTVDEDGLIECPLHGAVFDTADGSLLMGPTCSALPVYPVTVAPDGVIAVEIPAAAPEPAAARRASSFGDWGTGTANPAPNRS